MDTDLRVGYGTEDPCKGINVTPAEFNRLYELYIANYKLDEYLKKYGKDNSQKLKILQAEYLKAFDQVNDYYSDNPKQKRYLFDSEKHKYPRLGLK